MRQHRPRSYSEIVQGGAAQSSSLTWITILNEKGLLDAASVCYERLRTFYRDA